MLPFLITTAVSVEPLRSIIPTFVLIEESAIFFLYVLLRMGVVIKKVVGPVQFCSALKRALPRDAFFQRAFGTGAFGTQHEACQKYLVHKKRAKNT
jgi:hypothetical protein